ncbi:unnamed protein product, partial [marine sediment metagenome]
MITCCGVRRIPPSAILLLAALAISASAWAAQADQERPNVVFILTDDQRWDQLSCEGHPFLK